MPPYVPRKRTRDTSPSRSSARKKVKTRASGSIALPRKPTLFDDLDASSTLTLPEQRGKAVRPIEESGDEESGDDDSSLTSLSDGDFEDVSLTKGRKIDPGPHEGDDGEDEDDEDIELEDVQQTSYLNLPDAPFPSGDLELTLIKDTRISLINEFNKKGPSKLERKIRIATHCVHVQFLMWHNAIRNSWLCDPEVQGFLISHLRSGHWEEIERWRRDSGLEIPEEPSRKTVPHKPKGKGKGKAKMTSPQLSRQWGDAAQRLERGTVDMSHGDPLFRLVKYLSSWWKKTFRIVSPGIRKWGYMSLERLDRLTKAYKTEGRDELRFGERIETLTDFRRCAQELAGSRDVGAQLFTALLRGLGLDARMVANLQPLGFGWNKLEEAEPEKEESKPSATHAQQSDMTAQPSKIPRKGKKSARQVRGASWTDNRLDPTDDDDFELLADDSDDESVIVIPQAAPKRHAVYDKDLEFPHYWTEILSPVTNQYLPVDPIVKSIVGTNRELIESLEPRGSKADKVKQVMGYVVGFSADGTAKDITVRYLKRQMLPGRTKGIRMPVEKVPVYNRNGKIKRYEPIDWFKSVMRSYARGTKERPITEIDEEENATDLRPAQPVKKEVKEGEETLQYYKQSKEFVLERHLKREEALLPIAEPVRMFRIKGKGVETNEEPVYSRKDVVQVKSAETWHKQGRAPLPGMEPLKRVPYRAATTNRRREIAEAEAVTGEKVLQGLYSFAQTDWIIPPPIKDGVIPKNEYGNIDLFVEHMCPEGAVHVPYRGAMRVCKRLQIDYAEAVVDFEFGHRMAVPVIQGVVIAEEHHDRVMEEIAKDEAERARKEDEKKRKAALAMWRKFLMGIRIVERIRQDYGELKGDMEVFGHGCGRGIPDGVHQDEEDMAGGFLPEGIEVGEGVEAHQKSGFFPVVDDDDDDQDQDALQVDHGGDMEPTALAYPTPQSGTATTSKRKGADKRKTRPKSPRQRRRRVASTSDEGDEEGEPGDSDEGF